MVDQPQIDAALKALDEQIADFDAMLHEGTPDRVPRWERTTAGILANLVSPEEAKDFNGAGLMPVRHGQRSDPFRGARRRS